MLKFCAPLKQAGGRPEFYKAPLSRILKTRRSAKYTKSNLSAWQSLTEVGYNNPSHSSMLNMFTKLLLFGVLVCTLASRTLSAAASGFSCEPIQQESTDLRAISCIQSLRNILHKHPESSYLFSALPFRSRRTINVPLIETYRGCTITLGLFYVTSATEAMSNVVATADRIIEDCVDTRQFSGGTARVGNSGLQINISPARRWPTGGLPLTVTNINGSVTS